MSETEDLAKAVEKEISDTLSNISNLSSQQITEFINKIKNKLQSSPDLFNALSASAKTAFDKIKEIAIDTGSTLLSSLGSSIDKIVDKLPELGEVGVKAISALYLSTQELSSGYKKIGEGITSVSRISTEHSSRYIDFVTKQMPKALGECLVRQRLLKMQN
jgi:uncharacterized phage infection (PIP) family protein YhgE